MVAWGKLLKVKTLGLPESLDMRGEYVRKNLQTLAFGTGRLVVVAEGRMEEKLVCG